MPFPETARPILVVREPSAQSASRPPLRNAPRLRYESLHRAMNVSLATIGLVLAAPILLVFAVLVKVTSPGPIFYSQARVGLDRRKERGRENPYDRRTRNLGGHPFMIYKFRTMGVNAERPNSPVWAAKGDARVTAVGRVMRKYRIDELPQLFN
ncbi:MAG: sugar transferase, partial [Gemmatimonadaceae bacterium]